MFLVDNPGVLPGKVSEQDASLRRGARMYWAQTVATVPKFEITMRKAYGFSSMVMSMIPHDGQSGVFSYPVATLGANGSSQGSTTTLAAMSEESPVLVSVSDGVATVTLNRPEVRNAINLEMQQQLAGIWTGFRYDDGVRCVVLAAEGPSFCTGIDRAEAVSDENNASMAAGDYPGYPTPWMYDDPGRDLGPKSRDLWKPVIAAVQGIACGGAFYMLGETEFIIASEDATFFDPHVTYGMTAAYEPIQMLSKMPFPEVMRMSLMGVHERVSAERAREVGLVTEVVAADDLLARAQEVAQIIADSPPLVVQGTMRALWTAFEMPKSQAIGMANLFTRVGSDAAAFKAGQERFSSGERPRWTTR
jgi:enoyl-CoA hydratase/carnithine racemase